MRYNICKQQTDTAGNELLNMKHVAAKERDVTEFGEDKELKEEIFSLRSPSGWMRAPVNVICCISLVLLYKHTSPAKILAT